MARFFQTGRVLTNRDSRLKHRWCPLVPQKRRKCRQAGTFAKGQKLPRQLQTATSGLPRTTDIDRLASLVCLVPKAK